MSISEKTANNKGWSAWHKLSYEIKIFEIRWLWNCYPFAYYDQFFTFVTSKVGQMSILEEKANNKV